MLLNDRNMHKFLFGDLLDDQGFRVHKYNELYPDVFKPPASRFCYWRQYSDSSSIECHEHSVLEAICGRCGWLDQTTIVEDDYFFYRRAGLKYAKTGRFKKVNKFNNKHLDDF